MWGNEDTFWVANDGSGATDKLFAYNRSDGSRDSANDFDNLNGAGNNQPWGICSDGTTMFVGDRTDDKLYAYKMSDTTADSTKDITLNSGNGDSRGMWCDGTTVYVANDGATTANKVFAYTISGGAYDSTKDFEELYLSTNTAAQNAETPRGIWSNGTTMFVADGDDDNVFAYKHSDESQDSAKNLALSGDNDNPRGMWFDGRVLWVVDGTDDHDLRLRPAGRAAGQHSRRRRPGGPQHVHQGRLHGRRDGGRGERGRARYVGLCGWVRRGDRKSHDLGCRVDLGVGVHRGGSHVHRSRRARRERQR